MKRHIVLLSFAAAMISGAVFVVALFHQFALVEVAASSAIGDLLDEKRESNRARNSAVALMTVFLVGFYSFHAVFPLAMNGEVTMTEAQVTFDQ